MLKTEHGCIDFVYSPDDGGWYAQEYDFTRADNATRTTRLIYPTKEKLASSLRRFLTRKWFWEKWS